MNPTQYELATLATRIPTGSTGERLNAALAIWEAAGDALRPAGHRLRAIPCAEADPWNDWQPLDKILVHLLPTLETGDRLTRWRDFLPHWENLEFERALTDQSLKLASVGAYQENEMTITPEEIHERAEATMQRHREHGVRRTVNIEADFIAWNQSQMTRIRSERGKKEHAAKKSVETLPASKKPRKRTVKPHKQTTASAKQKTKPLRTL